MVPRQLQAQAPNATILGVGVNVGRGPASFIGNVDALSLTMAGQQTTYDFEVLDESKASCKQDRWKEFHNPPYKNQGDCVSHFASAKRQGPKREVAAAAAARHTARTERAAAKVTAKATKPAKAQKAAKANKGKASKASANSKPSKPGKSNSKGK